MPIKSLLTYGFAIFAMFFGSGNLVFPLQIGHSAGAYWLFGFFGLLLTGIFLPSLGLFVIKLHHGDYYKFFGEAGKVARFVLPLFTLSLLGSFGVVPRCIAVAHGGVDYLTPDLPLIAFSAIFCVVTFVFCLKDHVMVDVLGKYMSPILLVALLGVIAAGVWHAPLAPMTTTREHAFLSGFLNGYQTMDLFAAFFFSALVFTQIKNSLGAGTTDAQVLRVAILPSVIGSAMIAVVYFGLVFLGSHYASHIDGIEPEMMLPSIVKLLIGKNATIVIAVAMVLSCLTTAVALNNIYARFLCTLFKLGDHRFTLMLVVTTTIAFVISLLDFRGIASFLAPALEISYPGLIALTIMSIVIRDHQKTKATIFWSITALMIVLRMS